MPMTPIDHAIIGGVSGTIEVCLLQPTIAMKNAFQEGRPLQLAPGHLYRGIGVRTRPSPAHTASQMSLSSFLIAAAI